jgi:hypothetical protein
MIVKVIELEENILKHKEYLLSVHQNTENLLSQISMILDFGLDNDKLNKWYRLNKVSINTIYELIEEKETSESLTN